MPSFPAGVCANRPCESQAELAGTALGDKTVSVSSMRGSSFSHWLGSPQGLSEASLALGWTQECSGFFLWESQVASSISACSVSLVQVGCFLKTPRFPIWVVCSESHFSVLFSLQPELLRDWRAERLFDLYYYDGLANQQEQICLTIGALPPHPVPAHPQGAPRWPLRSQP